MSNKALEFTKRKAKERAKVIDKEFGTGQYGGTDYMKKKEEERKKKAEEQKKTAKVLTDFHKSVQNNPVTPENADFVHILLAGGAGSETPDAMKTLLGDRIGNLDGTLSNDIARLFKAKELYDADVAAYKERKIADTLSRMSETNSKIIQSELALGKYPRGSTEHSDALSFLKTVSSTDRDNAWEMYNSILKNATISPAPDSLTGLTTEELNAITEKNLFGKLDEVITKEDLNKRYYDTQREFAAATEFEEQDRLGRELDTIEMWYDLQKDKEKYGNDTNKDTALGQFESNYDIAWLERKAAKAYELYIENPSEENLEITKYYEVLINKYKYHNKKPLDEHDVKAPWITKTAASYIPQFIEQSPAEFGGAVAGAAVTAPFGASALGAPVGAGIASAIFNYDQIRASVFRELVNAGVDEDVAFEVSEDEAIISALIEGAGSALSFVSTGGGKAIDAIADAARVSGSTKTAAKLFTSLASARAVAGAKKAAFEASHPLLDIGFGIAGDAASNYAEEFFQQGVSIANKERALRGETGLLDLTKDTGKTVWDAVSGKNPEALSQMHESGIEGAKISVMFGGGQAVINNTISYLAGANTRGEMNSRLDDIIKDEAALDALIEESKKLGARSAAIASMIEESKSAGNLSSDQVESLINTNAETVRNIDKAKTVSSAVDNIKKANKNVAVSPVAGGKKGDGSVSIKTSSGEVITARGEYYGNIQGRDIYIVEGEAGYHAIDSTTGLVIASGETKRAVKKATKEAEKAIVRTSENSDVGGDSQGAFDVTFESIEKTFDDTVFENVFDETQNHSDNIFDDAFETQYSFGENGKKQFEKFKSEVGSALDDEAIEGFSKFYEAGRNGLTLEQAQAANSYYLENFPKSVRSFSQSENSMEQIRNADFSAKGGGVALLNSAFYSGQNDRENGISAASQSFDEAESSRKGDTLEDSSIVLERDENKYPYNEQEVIEGYEDAVDNRIMLLAEKIRKGQYNENDSVEFGKTGSSEIQAVSKILGIDVSGYDSVVEARQIRHIITRHGINGKADESMRNDEDIARLKFVIDNYDDAFYGGTSSAYTTIKQNGKPREADTVVFAKKINGTYFVVQAVPQTKKKKLFVVSAFISDKPLDEIKEQFFNKKQKNRTSRDASLRESSKTSVVTSEAAPSENSNDPGVQNQKKDSSSLVGTNSSADTSISENGTVVKRKNDTADDEDSPDIGDIKKATRFGDEGAQLVAELMRDGMSLEEAQKAVKPMYIAGFTGGDVKRAKTDIQKRAFDAGTSDKVAQREAARSKAKKATVRDGSLIENEASKKLSKVDREIIKTVAKDLGLSVSVAEKIVVDIKNGVEYDARHRDGELTLTGSRPVFRLVLHEAGHRMEQFATEEWNTLCEALYERAEQLGRRMDLGATDNLRFDRVKGLHDKAGITMDTSGYVGEVVMRELETIFSSPKEYNKWLSEISSDRKVKSAWRKFMDFVSGLFGKVRNALKNARLSKDARARMKSELAELERIRGLYAEAYKATRDAVEQRRKDSIEVRESDVAGENVVSYSFKNADNKKSSDGAETRNAVLGNNSITQKAIEALRLIGPKSINKFTSDDIKIAEPFARRMWKTLGTKSPFFRSWFGDWRANDKNTEIKIATIPEYIATNEARKKNRGLVRNTDTEWDINISRQGETNTISHSGKNKLSEFGLSGIRELIENAVLLDCEVHEHHNNNAVNDYISFDHKLYALGKSTNGSIALYKITVEEYFQSKTEPENKRFHNLRYIEKVADVGGRTFESSRSGGSTDDNSATMYSISDLFSLVKTYDKEFSPKEPSKVVNADGVPMVVYHGTAEEFNIFDLSKSGSNFANLSEGMFFFTNKKEAYPNSASDYAENASRKTGKAPVVKEVYLDIKKPLKLDSRGYYQTNIYFDMNADDIYSKYFSGDYDGIIIENSDKTADDSILYLVDNSTQIKSATDNIGTFDRNDPDTRFAIAGYRAKNADQSMLDKAFQMELDGKSAKTIYRETGWYRGFDGRWRFEISDNDSRYYPDGDAQFAEDHSEYARYIKLYDKLLYGNISDREFGEYSRLYDTWERERRRLSAKAKKGTVKLYNVLSHPTLFEAYPWLKNITVRFADLDKNQKAAVIADTIYISKRLPKGNVKRSLLHEIQHLIQEEEGFTRGASIEYWENAVPTKNARDLYMNTAGEIEARQVQERMDWTDSQRRKKMPFTGDENTVTVPDQYLPSEVEDNDSESEVALLGKGLDGEGSKFTYEALTSLPDMEVPVIGSETDIKFTDDGRIDKAYIFKTVRDKCEKIITKKREPTYVTDVPALGGKVELPGKGIRHGFENGLKTVDPPTPGSIVTARAELALPEILKSSIEVNRKNGRDSKTDYSSVLLGAVAMQNDAGNIELYAVRSVVEMGKNKTPVLVEYGVIGSLHASNAKKTDVRKDWVSKGTESRTHRTSVDISISQLLDSVKGVFDDTLSNDVYEHFGMTRSKGGFADGLNYSLKDNNDTAKTDTRELLDTIAQLKHEFEITKFAKADPKKLSEMVRSILKDYSSKADSEVVMSAVDELYTYMANGEDGNPPVWNEVYSRALDIASGIVENAVKVDDTAYREYADLRNYLRNVPMKFDVRHDGVPSGYSNFNEFRKKNFGRLRFSNDGLSVDSVYQELAQMYPQFFDAENEITTADQLERIADVLDEIRPIESNPYAMETKEAARYLANDLLNRFYDIPQAKPTFADKAERRVLDAKIEGQRKVEKAKAQRDIKIQKLRDNYGRIIQNVKDEKTRALDKQKAKHNESLAKMSESRRTTEMRTRIFKHASELNQRLVHGTDNKHIPQELQGAVLILLESINLESNIEYVYGKDAMYHRVRRNTELGGESTKKTQAFNALRDIYSKLEGYVVIDPDMLGPDGILSEVINLADKRITDMTIPELNTVWKAIKAIEASVRSADKMFSAGKFRRVSDAAEGLRADNADKSAKKDLRYGAGLQKLIGLDMLTPETYFHYLGDTGDQIFRMMRDAQDKHISIMKEVADFTHEAMKGVNIKKLEKELKTVKLGGKEITLTTAQLMELYTLMKRNQAKEHVFVGGILPDTIKGHGLHDIKAVEPVTGISQAEILDSLMLLTEDQRKLADKLQEYASTVLGKYGNEASLQVYNYEKFHEKNYWPIRTNKQEISTDIEKDTAVSTVANKGMAKVTVPDANTSLRIGSIFDTFASHASDMATYAAWLGTTEDINRIRNFVFWEDGVRTGTVKGILGKVHGSRGAEYLQNLLADISVGIKSTNTMNPFEKLMGNYKAASIGSNFRVIIQQPTAILRAVDMIGAQWFAPAFVKNPIDGWNKAKKHAPIAQWKDWGYFDINTGRQMKDVLFDNASVGEKIKQFEMSGAGFADSISWGVLWNAVEAATKAKHKGLEVGSEAYYKAVAERFTEIADHTQVVDGILQRSQIMRNGDTITKMATSFMGEPTKQYNMVASALYDVINKPGKDKSKAIKHFGRMALALAISGVVNSAAQSIIDAMRDDDEEKKYWERWLAAFPENLKDTVNVVNYIPFVKDIVSIVQGYDVKRMDMETIASTYRACENMIKSLSGAGKNTILESSLNLVAELARLGGYSVSNVKRMITSIADTFAIETDNYLMQYHMEKAVLDINFAGNRSSFIDILYNAYNNDREAYEIIYNDLIENGITDEDIKDGMETRMKKAAGTTEVSDLDKRYMSPEDERRYDNKLKQINESDVWKKANEDQRKDAKADLYYFIASAGEKAKKTRKEAAEYGVDETEYVLWQLAKSIADNSNDNNDSMNEKEKSDAIGMLPGLGDSEIAYFYNTEEADKAYENGMDMRSYAIFKGSTADITGDDKRGAVADTILQMDVDDDTAWDLYLTKYDNKGTDYARDNGIEGNTYLKFIASLDLVDKPTESGKYGKYTQDEVKDALKLDMFDNLTREEKAVLWQSMDTTWAEKNNPYR